MVLMGLPPLRFIISKGLGVKHFGHISTWTYLSVARGLLSSVAVWLCVLILCCTTVYSQDSERRIALITNKENPLEKISESELKRIYERKETKLSNGVKLVPFNQSEHNDIYREFSQEVFGKSPETMRSYWIGEKISRNATPPTAKAFSQTLLKYVRRIAGAIAYIYEDEVDDTVKVITVTGTQIFAEANSSDSNASSSVAQEKTL